MRTKPFPDAYLLAMKQLDAGPHECISIEDTSTGMQAALAAGLRCIVVRPDSFHAGNAFVGAAHVSSSLLEAAHWALSESLHSPTSRE
ncbi:HAD family hydrolase [Streptococcus pyogenes]|uniref:HAD family hydrolase n=1 Tax=Streptococcus pyogenes TaxID=1314 RepID=UPI003DA1145F